MARHDLRVWEKPIANQTYVLGCDPAHGLERGDDSVIQVIRMETGVQVCEVQGKIDPIALGEKCYEIGTWYNNALVAIENNQDGGANRTLFNCSRVALSPSLRYSRTTEAALRRCRADTMTWSWHGS